MFSMCLQTLATLQEEAGIKRMDTFHVNHLLSRHDRISYTIFIEYYKCGSSDSTS